MINFEAPLIAYYSYIFSNQRQNNSLSLSQKKTPLKNVDYEYN